MNIRRIELSKILVLTWLRANNFFVRPMKYSFENAYNILTYVRNAAYELRLSDPLMMDNYNDIQPWFLTMENFMSESTEDKEAQFSFTDDVEARFEDMQLTLEHFQDVFRGSYGKSTPQYRTVWGRTLNRFYHGPYVVRANAILALSVATRNLGGATMIALADEMLAYNVLLTGTRSSQQGQMANVKTDSTNINSTVDSAATFIFKIYGRTVELYAEQPNFETLIAAIFPIGLLTDHPNPGHYPMIISKGTIHRICILIDKTGKKFKINTMGCLSPVLITYSNSSKYAGTGGYTAAIGLDDELIDPTIVGDVTKKYVIGTCISTLDSAHFTFDIVDE